MRPVSQSNPAPWWKRAHDAISVLRSVEWVVLKIAIVVALAVGATGVVGTVTELPFEWRVGVSLGSGIAIGLIALVVFIVLFSPRSSSTRPVVQSSPPAVQPSPLERPEPPVPEATGIPRVREAGVIDIDLKYVESLYQSMTGTQAEKVLAGYIGKRSAWSGKVRNVKKISPSLMSVWFERMQGTSQSLSADFRDKSIFDRLELLRRGEEITIRGEITKLDDFQLELGNCELVQPR
jgi:hypothetical protein